MGREYFGDIEGKFAFGIQNSNDIENLISIEYIEKFKYLVCNCVKEENGKNYCDDCYASHEEHVKVALEEECIEEDDENLFSEDNYILYEITQEHKKELIENLEELKNLLPENVLQKFNEIKNNERIINGYDDIFKNISIEMDKYVEQQSIYFFRYKLGLQILYILNKQDTCNLYCEVY